jgi:hypothetical protein
LPRRLSLHQPKLIADTYWLIVLGLPLIAFGSYYGQGLSTGGDNLLHLYRLVALHKNIVEGNFYPRWTAELFLGFGYPLLNFYASSTYYVAELLHLLGVDYEHAFIYTLLILLVFASIGTYRLSLDIFEALGVDSRVPALLSTAAYTFAPYVFYNLYIRGAIAEVGAQALLPWLLWSFRRLICHEHPATYLLWAIFSLAGLALTHTVSLLLVPPILLIYALVLLWRYRDRPTELWQRLAWFGIAIVSSAALSAFFWLPILAERQFLTTQAQEMSARYMSSHIWTWDNIVDPAWLFSYNNIAPPRLGLVQLILAVGGLLLVRQWNAEWLAIMGLAFLSCLLIGRIALPLWTSHPLLLTVQFPWRLLGIATLPIALLTGGLLTRGFFGHSLFTPRQSWYQATGLSIILGIIIFANYPRMEWLGRLQLEPAQINLTSISQYEAITKRYGLSSATFREFMPWWVKDLQFEAPVPTVTATPLSVTLDHASAQTLQATVAAPRPSRLLFTTFFFPGWQIMLDDGQLLEPYSSSDLGLLTVELPSGKHRLSLNWHETPTRGWGWAISMLTLLLLGIFHLSYPQLRLLALYPLIPLLLAIALSVAAPLLTPPYHQTPEQPSNEGIQLLGYYTYQDTVDSIYIFPHWYVEKRPTDLIMQWKLLDKAGKPVATTSSFPYFNTLRAFQWSPNMLVDDAYYLSLPPGLVAGVYTLAMTVVPTSAVGSARSPQERPVGQIRIDSDVPVLPQPATPLDIHFSKPEDGSQITLRGYAVEGESPSGTKLQPQSADPYFAVAPGDTVIYTLQWQSQQAVPDGTQVFNQLLDHDWQTLTQVNQPLELSHGVPYYLWNPYWVKENTYSLRIPEDAAGGLYQPYVGIYDLNTKVRFLATEADGTAIGDAAFLPPIKVVRRTAAPLANPVSVRFGDAITLEGYEVTLPEGGLRPQSTMTVTLQYKSLSPTEIDYTQFIHLYDTELGMAAQVDTPPQRNGNPTSTWIPGEVIVDTIPLQIPEQAKPGRYTLSMGLYDPASGGARLPVVDQSAQPQPDNQFILGELEVH